VAHVEELLVGELLCTTPVLHRETQRDIPRVSIQPSEPCIFPVSSEAYKANKTLLHHYLTNKVRLPTTLQQYDTRARGMAKVPSPPFVSAGVHTVKPYTQCTRLHCNLAPRVAMLHSFQQMEKPREVGEVPPREYSQRFQRALGVLAKVRRGSHLEQVIRAACDIVDKHLVW